MDTTDQQIIELLHRNGRMSYEEIARTVHLSRPAVFERVRKLELGGVIKGYQAQVDWTKAGYPVTALIRINYDCLKALELMNQLKQISSAGVFIINAYRINGDYCVFLKVRAESTLALQELLDAILELPGVTEYKTNVILSTLIENEQVIE